MIDRYDGMCDHFGDHQRQIFLMGHAGPLRSTVLEQIEILGTEVME